MVQRDETLVTYPIHEEMTCGWGTCPPHCSCQPYGVEPQAVLETVEITWFPRPEYQPLDFQCQSAPTVRNISTNYQRAVQRRF